MEIIDLSMALDENLMGIKKRDNLPVYLGYECRAYDFSIGSHVGTYFETSLHLFPDGKSTDEVPAEKLFYEATILRLPQQAERKEITAAELEKHGFSLRSGDALIVYTAGQRDRYFTRDAVRWMIAKKVTLLGADLDRYDSGFVNPTGMFIDLFKAEIPIIAGLVNLSRIAKDRFILVVLPLKIKGVSTAPCRVVAIQE